MAMVKFTYYIRDDYTHSERTEYIALHTGLARDDVQDLDIGNPFHEVGLKCLLDTETGEVIILGVDQ